MRSLTETWRRHALPLLLITLVTALYFVWSWNNQIGDMSADGANYLMLAEHFAWHGDKDPVYQSVAVASRFPPGFPVLLGAFDASRDLLRAHWVTIACLPLALIALYVWLAGEGFTCAQSALQLLLLALLPGTVRLGLLVQSEYLYLFWSLLALILMRAAQATRRSAAVYGAAVAVAAAMLTREIGVSLLPPLLIVLSGLNVRTALIAVAIALVPSIDWHLVHYSPQNYGRILHQTYQGGFIQQLQLQLATELPALRDGFGRNLMQADQFAVPGYWLGALCLAVLLWRALQRKLEAVYCIANLTILVLWPYPEEAARFLWVLLPLMLAQPLLLLANLRAKPLATPAPSAMLAVTSAVLLTMALPALAFFSTQYRDAAYCPIPGVRGYIPWYRTDPVAARAGAGFELTLADLLLRARTVVPNDDCVMAARPDMVNYFTRRRSYFPPPGTLPDARFETAARALGCHYALVYMATDRQVSEPMYPRERIKAFGDLALEGRLPRGWHKDEAVVELWHLRAAANGPPDQ